MIKSILMCEPNYFDVNYDINPWMTNNIGNVDIELANKQWKALYNELSKVFNVKLIKSVPGNPDLVFTANAGFYSKDHKLVYLANFKNEQRKAEEKHFYDWFKENNYNLFFPSVPFEGEGDILRGDMHTHWIGYGFRSSHQLKKIFPFSELHNDRYLHMVDPRFYHLDTCLMPLRNGNNGVLWYPGAFSEESQAKIRKHSFKKSSIEVTEEEALTFCCNAVIINDKAFIPKCPSVAKKLMNLGYSVKQFEMSEFLKSGGACKCLVMFLE